MNTIPNPAAPMAPMAIAKTKGTSLSLRIIVKFIASAKATPRPKHKPYTVVIFSATPASSFHSTDINNPPSIMIAVINADFDRASFKITFDKIAAKIGTVATPISTTATGAKAIARLKSVAFGR